MTISLALQKENYKYQNIEAKKEFIFFLSILKFFALVVNPGFYLEWYLKGNLIFHRENQVV